MNTKEGLSVPGRRPPGMIVVGYAPLLERYTSYGRLPVLQEFLTLPSKVVAHCPDPARAS
jgi:hypothetical protein